MCLFSVNSPIRIEKISDEFDSMTFSMIFPSSETCHQESLENQVNEHIKEEWIPVDKIFIIIKNNYLKYYFQAVHHLKSSMSELKGKKDNYMPMIAAKCTQCNAILQVNSSKDAAICDHCGTAFIIEKAINFLQNYHSYANHSGDFYSIKGL